MHLSTPFRLILSRQIHAEMIEHAQQDLPNECCGLLAGQVSETPSFVNFPMGIVMQRYPLINDLASPLEFCSEPHSLFHAIHDMDARGWEILAVYHSHPTTEPIPSRLDHERNYSASVINLIISFSGGIPSVRAWWIDEMRYHEAEWQIIDMIETMRMTE